MLSITGTRCVFFLQCVFLLLLCGGFLRETTGHAFYLTQSTRCARALTVGTNIMGRPAIHSIDRSVYITTTNGDPIVNGSRYSYNDELVVEVVVATSGEEYLIELTSVAGDSLSVSGGGIINGKCSNTRVSATSDAANARITTPSVGTAVLAFKAAWAKGNTEAVKISDTVYLYPPVDIIAAPTAAPTRGSKSSQSSSSSTIETISELPTGQKTGVSILIGLICAIIVALAIYLFAWYRATHPYDNTHISDKKVTLTRVTEGLALIFALTSLILVSVLATDNGPGYLGKPNWQSNLFAWHPVLMVAGFFFCQVLGIASWTFMPSYTVARYGHVFSQIAAFTTLVSGIWAIWEYKARSHTPNYTTLHSWLGMATVVMFMITFVWGIVMHILTRHFPDSILRQVFDLKTIHKQIALMTFTLTVLTTVSGLMDKYSASLCTPVLPSSTDYDTDAAQYYHQVPSYCKIANGLGIVIMLVLLLLTLAVAYRGDSFGLTKLKLDSNTIQLMKENGVLGRSESGDDNDEENQHSGTSTSRNPTHGSRRRRDKRGNHSKVPAEESDGDEEEEEVLGNGGVKRPPPIVINDNSNNNNNNNINNLDRETLQRIAEEQERALQRKLAASNSSSGKVTSPTSMKRSPSAKSPKK